MREIKFRAYSLDGEDNRMDYFDLTEKGYNVPWIAENCEIMQYTGLKDKNGFEIYEGDIVAWRSDYTLKKPDCYMPVEFHVSAGRVELRPYINQDCEIVGNIYENQELLK